MRRLWLCLWLLALLLPLGTAAATDPVTRFRPISIEIADPILTLTPLERSFVQRHPTLRVGIVRSGLEPFEYVNVRGEVDGYAVAFMQYLAASAGFDLVPVVYEHWQDVVAALRRREIDLVPHAAVSEPLKQFMVFTGGTFRSPAGIFGRRQLRTVRQDADISWHRVSVVRDFASEYFLPLQFPNAIPVPEASVRAGLEDVITGRADYYFGDVHPVLSETNRDISAGVELIQRVYYGTGWSHIAIRSDWPLVTRILDKFISRGQAELGKKVDEVADNAETLSSLQTLNLTESDVKVLAQYDRLRLAVREEDHLLSGIDGNGQHTGIASEYTRPLARHLGLPLSVTAYADERSMLDALAAGEADIVPLVVSTTANRTALALTRDYLEMPWMVVGPATRNSFWSLDSLADGRLAMHDDHPLRAHMADRYPQLTIVPAESELDAFRRVARGEADVALALRLSTSHLLNVEFPGKLQVLGTLDEAPAGLAMALGVDAMPLLPAINRSLATLGSEFATQAQARWAALDSEPERRLRQLLRWLVPLALILLALALVVVYWNRRIAAENRSRQLAEQRLIDMTEGLRTGVFQFRQKPGDYARLVFANATTRKLARLPGRSVDTDRVSFFDYVHPEEQGYIRARLAEAMNTGGHFREIFRFQFPDGSMGWILSDAISRREPDGAIVWNGYLFDLTSERLLSESLNRILVDKDQFIAMAGHELKTPVQNVLLAVEAIDAAAGDSPLSAPLSAARQAAYDLAELIDDLVDVSAMDAREITLNPEPLDIATLVQGVCRTFTSLAEQKGLTIHQSIAPDLPSVVWADPLRVRQILYNLIGNATKYTDQGDITVAVRCLSPRESLLVAPVDDAIIQFEVVDTGIGIPPDRVPHIFDPFATVGPITRKSTGLGLAICKRLAVIMDGRIEVESVQGVGSTFRVTLPLPIQANAHGSRKEQHAAARRHNRWNPQSRTLLLVEDDLLVRETLASLLESNGWSVLRADSGTTALQKLDCGLRAVITDQQMPGMDGITFAREAWQRFETSQSRPVMILMTGGMSADNTRAANGYFDTIMVKPVNSVQIQKIIDELTGVSA